MSEEWKMVGKPALVLIHMQDAITSEKGTLAAFGHAKATKESGIIARQQALLKAFRAKKLPVIFVNAVTDPQSKLPAYGKFWRALKETGANLPGSKDIVVIPELAPLPGEPVFENWVFGMFSNNKMEKVLKELGVQTLVLAGVATDMAVLAAVYQSSDMLYNLIVPSDASTSANLKFHEVALEMISVMTLVTPTEDVIAHL